MSAENLQKSGVGLTLLGVAGLVANQMNKRDDKILGMEPDTQRKFFLGMVLFGNALLLITSLKKIK